MINTNPPNRYDELTPDMAAAADRIINALASSSGHITRYDMLKVDRLLADMTRAGINATDDLPPIPGGPLDLARRAAS